MTRFRSPSWLWAPVLFLVGLIFGCSSLTAADIHRLNIWHIPSDDLHRIGHFLEYCALGFLFLRALLYTHTAVTRRRVFIVALIALILFAGTDEWHQTFVTGRHGRASDVLYDILCFSVGMLFYYLVKKTQKNRCAR